MHKAITLDNRILHVVPCDDLIEHLTDISADCICGPTIHSAFELQSNDLTVLVTHHALDGREHNDPDHDREKCPLCRSDPA